MTDALALAVGSIDLSQNAGRDSMQNNDSESGSRPSTPVLIGGEPDEHETDEDHANALPGSTYRKHVLKDMLPALKKANCI
jgi:hypothetical protein